MNLKLNNIFDAMRINRSCERNIYWLNCLWQKIYKKLVFVPLWINYIAQPQTWLYVLKMIAPYFLIKDPNTWANLCENLFSLSFHQNYNANVSMRNKLVWRKRIQQLHQFRRKTTHGHIWLTELCSCVLIISFRWNWWSFAFHQMRPLKWKKIASTNKLSWNFVQHVWYMRRVVENSLMIGVIEGYLVGLSLVILLGPPLKYSNLRDVVILFLYLWIALSLAYLLEILLYPCLNIFGISIGVVFGLALDNFFDTSIQFLLCYSFDLSLGTLMGL